MAQRFADEVAVTVVEVPVQVVRKGEPVRGLSREDFIVIDRGVERELIDFEILDVLTTRPAPGSPEPSPSPVGVPFSSERVTSVRGRHLLFLFDFQFAPRRRLEISVAGARRLVASALAPGDRVAVAMYTGSAGANILVGFTEKRAEIELGLAFVDALARRRPKEILRARKDLVEYWSAVTVGRGEERLQALAARLGPAAALALSGISLGGEIMSLAEYDAISGDGGGRGAGGTALDTLVGPRFIDDRAVEMEGILSQLLVFGESMSELATLLREIPHPKQLVYFSEGFPTGILGNAETRARAIDRLRPGIRAMQAAGWAIQAIDIEGVPDSLADSGRSATAEVDPAATTFVTGNLRGDIRPQTGQGGFDAEALAYLSGETGGQVIENFNDVGRAGERILAATAVTYLLVFQPEDLAADGSYHELKVELARPIPGARLLHRPGYVAPAPVGTASDTARRMDEARLVMDDDTVLDLAASSLVLSGRKTRFVVEVAAPELLAGRSAGRLDLELQVYVFASDDTLEQHSSRRLTLDLARVADRIRQGGLRLSGAVDLPDGRHRLRLVLRDLDRDRVFARSHTVDPPVDGESWALAPVFFDPAEEALFLEVLPAGWGEMGLPTDRFVPAASAVVPSGGTRPLFFLFSRPDAAPASVRSRVLDTSGQTVEGATLSWRERLPDSGDGITRLLGIFDAGSLAAGQYRVELSIDDGTGAAPILATCALAVGP